MIGDALVVRLLVDGSEVEVSDGVSLLHALSDVGVDVPSLCDDRRLAPVGECRMCLVRVDGDAQLVAACLTRARAGMVVETASTEIESMRAGLLQMLARHYPKGAAGAAPDEPLHRLLERYAVAGAGAEVPELMDDSHPCISIDMSSCIDCFRCVRICDEVQGQFAWQLKGRGASTRVVPSGVDRLIDSPCVSCGACVDTCPTGALRDKSVVKLGIRRAGRARRARTAASVVSCTSGRATTAS